jgi:hypothetical protein
VAEKDGKGHAAIRLSGGRIVYRLRVVAATGCGVRVGLDRGWQEMTR